MNNQYTAEDMKAIVTRLVSGEKSDKKFVKNHSFQWVFFNKENSFEFEAKTSYKYGREYTAIVKTQPLVLDIGAANYELGEAILKTF